MNEYTITEVDMVRLGFRLGSMYETYRMDGTSDGSWFYIQAELLPSGAVRCSIYGETPPLAGEWVRLDTKEVGTADDLRELVDEVFTDILDANQSLIRMTMPISYYEFRA